MRACLYFHALTSICRMQPLSLGVAPVAAKGNQRACVLQEMTQLLVHDETVAMSMDLSATTGEVETLHVYANTRTSEDRVSVKAGEHCITIEAAGKVRVQ